MEEIGVEKEEVGKERDYQVIWFLGFFFDLNYFFNRIWEFSCCIFLVIFIIYYVYIEYIFF